eukprot:scaffold6397_cov175-Ochromonas_danica.AAC.15
MVVHEPKFSASWLPCALNRVHLCHVDPLQWPLFLYSLLISIYIGSTMNQDTASLDALNSYILLSDQEEEV